MTANDRGILSCSFIFGFLQHQPERKSSQKNPVFAVINASLPRLSLSFPLTVKPVVFLSLLICIPVSLHCLPQKPFLIELRRNKRSGVKSDKVQHWLRDTSDKHGRSNLGLMKVEQPTSSFLLPVGTPVVFSTQLFHMDQERENSSGLDQDWLRWWTGSSSHL